MTRVLLACLAIPLLLASCKRTPKVAGGGADPSGTPAGGDWPQWGHTSSRNMVADAKGLPMTWKTGEITSDGKVDMATTENVLWVAKLGSETYGNPTISNGRIFIGTNNQGRPDARFKGDYSILKCLDAATGKTIWTLTVPKLGSGKVGDWEYLGIASSPTVVDDRVYIVTNRCEVMCLDVHGLADGNQGDQDEGEYMAYFGTVKRPAFEVKPTDADIIWRYDMRDELGVFPHNITSSSILVVGDLLYCSTSNGVTYDHTDTPSPKAPALIALDRKLAEMPGATPRAILYGEEGSGLSRRILHGNWTSPCWGEVGGKKVLLYGGPDGIFYAFDPKAVKDEDGYGVFPELWRYDCNPIEYRFRDGDRSRPIPYGHANEGPSEIIATPVFYKGRVYVGIGQDPEHGEGVGKYVCIDVATGKKVWDRLIMRALSTSSIVDDLVYTADYSGNVYCMDANTGELYWRLFIKKHVWGSTLVADNKLYLGDDKGYMTVVATDRMKALSAELGAPLMAEFDGEKLILTKPDKSTKELAGAEASAVAVDVEFPGEIYSSPITAYGALYVATQDQLYAIKAGGK